MIILDTNIVSALMLAEPAPEVISWMDRINEELLWITAISVYEIQFGIELLPEGHKKKMLNQRFEEMLRYDYRNRIIEFDVDAAIIASEVNAEQKRTGRNCDIRDVQIAGIALARAASLATRNTKDFEFEGLKVINPFN